MRNWWLIGLALFVSLGLGIGWTFWSHQPKLPAAIRTKVNFTVFNPKQRSGFDVAPSGYNYDDNSRTLTTKTVAKKSPTIKVVITQQATPPPFIEANQLYAQFIDKLNRVATLDSKYGPVYLTKPKNLGGGEAAVLNARGTLAIVQSETELSPVEWQQLFTNLEIVR